MLLPEARWLARTAQEIGYAKLSPMLNVGSQTEQFRTREQPWIEADIFAPARAHGVSIVHTDLQAMPGVDLVGDLTDPKFLAKIAALRFRSILCANLLEHVTKREAIAEALVQAVEPGGVLFVTCPQVFPYHPDPIDTMYRPTPGELAALFPQTTLVSSETVPCGNLSTFLWARFRHDPSMLLRTLSRRRTQVLKKTDGGLSAKQWIPWLWTPFYAACVVLRKLDAEKSE